MNEEIIFKWDREWDRELVGKCIWKSGLVKSKYHCSFSKQAKIWRNWWSLCNVFSCSFVSVRAFFE